MKKGSTAIVGTVVDCVATEVKSLGAKKLGDLASALKLDGSKISGDFVDDLSNQLKDSINGVIDKAIDDMRRRRRRMFSMKGLVGAAKSASDAALKDLKKGLDSASDKLEKDVKGQIKELDGLTGGKLTDGLNKYFCPAATTALSDVIGTTLLSAGWTFGTPKCVDDAIEKGCESLVKAATKRLRRRMGQICIIDKYGHKLA